MHLFLIRSQVYKGLSQNKFENKDAEKSASLRYWPRLIIVEICDAVKSD